MVLLNDDNKTDSTNNNNNNKTVSMKGFANYKQICDMYWQKGSKRNFNVRIPYDVEWGKC